MTEGDTVEERVTDEMVDRAMASEYRATSVCDLGDPYFKEIHREIMRAAVEAALGQESHD